MEVYLVTERTLYRNMYGEWEQKYKTNLMAFTNLQKAKEYANWLEELEAKDNQKLENEDIKRKCKIETIHLEN